MLEMVVLALFVGGFIYYMIGPESEQSKHLAALQREQEGLAELAEQAAWLQVDLERMSYDKCSICGKISQFASRCEKLHLDEVRKAKIQIGLKAFNEQEEWING